MYKFTAVLLIASVGFSAAQSLAGLPACAIDCVRQGLPSNCNLDPKCICSSSSFIDAISCCVAGACSVNDQNATLTYARTICEPAGVSDLVRSPSHSQPTTPTLHTFPFPSHSPPKDPTNPNSPFHQPSAATCAPGASSSSSGSSTDSSSATSSASDAASSASESASSATSSASEAGSSASSSAAAAATDSDSGASAKGLGALGAGLLGVAALL
ncbi:uncharacterized protein HMPREF1541_06658 [Cyphellophora europaea CBS 101466]|uniref:CFEM domain-containing protein n=1 Tax=Cyphellophora europaea (strain CBS 101466) TaxID=1220924 RepID=W2RQ17_CYPE1|nr:uncharacterized protein HMPREF1541_06658 [Cyphellophora europaea CBS 101466]ETN38621.1 hypothetical protein HMPREF1541_06658 [Cyphellophora europaea CBS 101466]